jgi:4-hydroxy-tetrahydrodipicolinate reductase
MIAASNFSVGVNIFFEVNKYLASLMNHRHAYQASMSEIHHTAKLDAPSGTAITLAEDLINIHHRYKSWENHAFTSAEVLSINSIREPDVPGTHVIKYVSHEDEIEIKHTAINRNGFAKGAIMAAAWIHNKKGIFSMKDVLGFRY